MKFPDGLRFVLAFLGKIVYTTLVHAGVLELVDEVDSKSTGGNTVPVRARPPAPKIPNANAFGIFTYLLKWVPTNGKWFVGLPFKTLKSHRQSSIREESLWDFLCRTHERTGNIRASRASVSVKEMRFHLLLSAPTIGSHIRSIRYSANLLRHRISDSQLLHRPDCK